MVISNKVPWNDGKNSRYIAGYQVDGGTDSTAYQDP